MHGKTDKWTDRQMDRQTNGQTDKQTYKQMDRNIDIYVRNFRQYILFVQMQWFKIVKA